MHEANKEFALTAVQSLTHQLEVGNFQVTLAAMGSNDCQNLMSALNALPESTTQIGPAIAEGIRQESMRLETVIFPEALIKKVYILPNRRYNSECLLTNPASLFRDGCFGKLEEIARQDIASACRCILFGEATAAAFHILRATESVLQSYYFHHRKQNRLPKPMWANMIDQLRAKKKNKPPTNLLDSLNLIRTAYRNPTQHPQAIYEIDGAQDLLGVCIDAIGKMASEL